MYCFKKFLFGCFCSSFLICAASAIEVPPFSGHNTLLIPKTSQKVKIDGKIREDEWGDAAVISGFTRYNYGMSTELLPEEQSTWFYFMYDNENLYVAMRSRNFPVGSMLKTDCKNAKDLASMLLHSSSMFSQLGDFQTIFNSSKDGRN